VGKNKWLSALEGSKVLASTCSQVLALGGSHRLALEGSYISSF
jgi:hypothetical protein